MLLAELLVALPRDREVERRTTPDAARRPSAGQRLRLVLHRPVQLTLVSVGGGTTITNTAFSTALGRVS